MVRIATVNDAEQLNILNDEFNGESETSIDNIRNSLMNNKQEVVIVADEDDMLVGFVCVQLKKSFCYDEYMPEITEVYVKPAYRKRGLASEMITFAEAYCSKNYPLHQYELLTGQENLVAQTVYNKLGYVDDNELHLSKRVKTERVYTRSATYQKFEVLKTNRNKRYKYGEFFVEGVRNINNAVENGWEIVSFLYDGDRIPVLKGRKTDKEKFAGAEATYTIEAMMKDGKALQSGTSHYFGDKFSKAYDVTFTGRDNQLHHPFQTSWGVSTRLVGAIIMTHGDDDGLILPPAVAPIQVVVVPIAAHKPGVSEKAAELAEKISKYARVKLDDSDNAPGWKFSQWEMKGVPLRLEIGPKDLEKNQCVLVRRDTREKVFVSLDELETAIPAQLEALRKDLYERALANREKRTWAATTMDEVKELAKANTGYIKTMWCGDLACEMKMKEEVGLSSRCMPFEQEHLSDVCPCCGKPAKAMVYWGVAY